MVFSDISVNSFSLHLLYSFSLKPKFCRTYMIASPLFITLILIFVRSKIGIFNNFVNTRTTETTIGDIIFLPFIVFPCKFELPQVKWTLISSIINFVYEATVQSPLQKFVFGNSGQNIR